VEWREHDASGRASRPSVSTPGRPLPSWCREPRSGGWRARPHRSGDRSAGPVDGCGRAV